MSSQRSGLSYLLIHSGRLKIAEEVLNLVVIFIVLFSSHALRTNFLLFVSISAFLITGILLTLHCTKIVMRKSDVPWHWIECIYTLVYALLYSFSSSVVLALWTKTYIIIAVFGFCAAILYIVDIVDKYQLATAPRKNYVWTTPNMPDLNY